MTQVAQLVKVQGGTHLINKNFRSGYHSFHMKFELDQISSSCVFLHPFGGISVVRSPIGLVKTGNVANHGVVWVGIAHQRAN